MLLVRVRSLTATSIILKNCRVFVVVEIFSFNFAGSYWKLWKFVTICEGQQIHDNRMRETWKIGLTMIFSKELENHYSIISRYSINLGCL